MRAVPAQARGAGPVDGEPRPRAPPQRSPGQRLDGQVDVVETGQPRELLADDGLLEPALRRGVHVLPVAAAAEPGTAVGTGPLDAVGCGLEDLDGVGAAVAGVAVLGHPDDHALPGQRVPDEDDPALVPRDAVPAVRDRADGHLELGAGPAEPASGPPSSAIGVESASSSVSPRRRSPGTGPRVRPSPSSLPIELSSCQAPS